MSDDIIFSAKNISAGVVNDVSIEVARGEIVGIAGITGSGRETLLGALYGATDRDEGSVRLDGRELPAHRPDLSVKRDIAYIPPDRRACGFMDLTARENISISDLKPLWRGWGLSARVDSREAGRWFTQLDVRPKSGTARDLATFSGGNQQKILLARWLRRKPRMLLLEEPTQGVDVAAKSVLHGQIIDAAAAGAAVAISSSDVEELVAICHRVLVMANGRIRSELAGTNINVQNITRASLHDDTATTAPAAAAS
jgi:ribose transport system ATP-binding protein